MIIERNRNIDVELVYKIWDDYSQHVYLGVERWFSLWIDDCIQMAPGKLPSSASIMTSRRSALVLQQMKVERIEEVCIENF